MLPTDGVPLNTAAAATSRNENVDFSETVKIAVGPHGIEFVVHLSVVTARSAWFKARLSGKYREDTTVVYLPDTDVDTFNEYLKFVYNQDLPSVSEAKRTDSEAANEHYEKLIRAWILADFLSDSRSANYIMNELHRVNSCYSALPNAANVTLVSETCKDTSPMYRYIRDLLIYSADLDELDAYFEDGIPMDFFFAVARKMKRVADGSDRHMSVGRVFQSGMDCSDCKYHYHGKDCPEVECEDYEEDDA